MFDTQDTGIGLLPGESTESLEADDQLAYQVTCLEMADDWTDDDRHFLPHALESIPLPHLAAVVSSVDRSKLNGFDVVRLLEAEHRLRSAVDAEMMASVAEVAHCPPGNVDSPVERSVGAFEYAASEVATALTWTRRRAERTVDHALALRETLPLVWERCASGDLSPEKAREFVNILAHHTPDVIDRVLDRTLDAAERLTTGQLRARLNRCVVEADPDAAKHGMAEGLADRKVAARQNPDLTASIGILSAHPNEVSRAMSNIDTMARALRALPGETRTLDQIRNDVAIDLLQGKHLNGTGRGRGGRVLVTIPASTLDGGDQPGFLEGLGPIPAEIARKLATDEADADWEFLVTDNGQPLATGTLRRRPTAAQKRRIRALYPTCVFPGCRRPAAEADLDHNRERSRGGATTVDNLAPLCRHHHGLRHATKWSYRRLRDGDHEWTSPLGHAYLRERDPPG